MNLFRKIVSAVCGTVFLAASLPFIGNESKAVDASKNVSDEVGIACNLFNISGENTADNTAVQWATTLKEPLRI